MSQYKAENDKKIRNDDVLQPTVLQLNPNGEKSIVTLKTDVASGVVDVLVVMRGGNINDPNDSEPLYESDGVTPLQIDFANGLTQTFEAPGGVLAVGAVPSSPLGGTFVIMRASSAQ